MILRTLVFFQQPMSTPLIFNHFARPPDSEPMHTLPQQPSVELEDEYYRQLFAPVLDLPALGDDLDVNNIDWEFCI